MRRIRNNVTMTRLILYTIITLCTVFPGFWPLTAQTVDGLELEFIVRQKPAHIDKYFEIIRDTAEIVAGTSQNIFIANMCLNLNVTSVDSMFADFDVHLTTVGEKPYSTAERFRIEFNLPARFENIPGKQGALYQLLVSPRQIIKIDTSGCSYGFAGDFPFKSNPSANFDFYFVPNSLADFHWNSLKTYLEAELNRFHDLFGLSLSSRINLFLCPCPMKNINWDSRFGYMMDPSRNSIYTIYSHSFISSESILPNMFSLLRLWGYTPPFILEGLAAYFEFNAYDMKKIMAEGAPPVIRDLLTSSGYYAADPHTAEVAAGSFVKYLADQYGPTKVKQWYIQSDDLTVLKNLQEIFGRPMDSLQQDWVNYIDTIEFHRGLFDFYAGRAGVLMQIDRQFEYLDQMARYDRYRTDSLDTWRKLAGLCFQTGQYYRAKEAYEKLVSLDSARAIYFQVLGNIDLINGDYETALEYFDRVIDIDTTYVTSQLQKAEIMAIKGDTAAAIELAENYYSLEKSIPGKISFLLFLGRMKKSPGPWHDSSAADAYFGDAHYWAEELISRSHDDPTPRYWTGMALFGMGDLDEAINLLETALFLETRSFYLGDILITLGKIYDLRGNRERALSYYREALNAPISVHNHELCTRYTKQPYTE